MNLIHGTTSRREVIFVAISTFALANSVAIGVGSFGGVGGVAGGAVGHGIGLKHGGTSSNNFNLVSKHAGILKFEGSEGGAGIGGGFGGAGVGVASGIGLKHGGKTIQLNMYAQELLAVATLAAVLIACSADGGLGGGFGGHHHHHVDYYAPPHYNFEYKVHDPHTGDEKSQHETREGDVVKGYYTVKEADGTLREVHYTADKHNGFNAEVKRIGHAHHAPVYGYHHHHY
uniref:Uncharacterized protein n=1 Tax=Rhodnius prolixus TaxID=13249 RepID=T1HMG6_RHOPR